MSVDWIVAKKSGRSYPERGMKNKVILEVEGEESSERKRRKQMVLNNGGHVSVCVSAYSTLLAWARDSRSPNADHWPHKGTDAF